MPEMSYPTITVRTEYPGSAPEEVENDISRPVEEALGVVGVDCAASAPSVAPASVTWSWSSPGTPTMSEAIQDSLEKLDLILLPNRGGAAADTAIRSVARSQSWSSAYREPWRPLSKGEEGLRRLRRIADLQIKRALEPIKGRSRCPCPWRSGGGDPCPAGRRGAPPHRPVDPEPSSTVWPRKTSTWPEAR